MGTRNHVLAKFCATFFQLLLSCSLPYSGLHNRYRMDGSGRGADPCKERRGGRRVAREVKGRWRNGRGGGAFIPHAKRRGCSGSAPCHQNTKEVIVNYSFRWLSHPKTLALRTFKSWNSRCPVLSSLPRLLYSLSLLPCPHTVILAPLAPPAPPMPLLPFSSFCLAASLDFFAAFFFAFSRALPLSVGSISYFVEPVRAGADGRGVKEGFDIVVAGRWNIATTAATSAAHANPLQ